MDVSRVVLGTRRAASQRYGTAGVFVGLLAALVPISLRLSGIFDGPGGNMAALGIAMLALLAVLAVMIIGPMLASYQGAGLAVCIAIPTCLILGVNASYWTAVETLRWSLWRWTGPPLGVFLGLPIGTVGYVVGDVVHQCCRRE